MRNERAQISTGDKIAALGAALTMVAGALYIRGEWAQEEPAPSPTVPSTETTTSQNTAAETSTSTSTTRPELGPAVTLEEGRLVDGSGIRIDNGHSWTVDCIGPPQSQGNPASEENEVLLPLSLDVRTSVLGIPKDTVYFGEQTRKPSIGDNAISHGWAVKYNSDTSQHTIYKFFARPKSGTLWEAEANGTPIAEPTLEELQTGIRFEDDVMRFTVKVEDSNADKPLRLTLSCKNSPR